MKESREGLGPRPTYLLPAARNVVYGSPGSIYRQLALRLSPAAHHITTIYSRNDQFVYGLAEDEAADYRAKMNFFMVMMVRSAGRGLLTLGAHARGLLCLCVCPSVTALAASASAYT